MGSVARALAVQRPQIWRVTTVLLSAELEPSKTDGKPHISLLWIIFGDTLASGRGSASRR